MATPVIFVTSRDAEDDIVTALRDGADDYMVKPIRRMELLSRIEAVRRRYGLHEDLSETILIPPFRFDLTARQVTRNDIPIEKLTEKEFQLALFMFRNLGRLLSRGHLLEAIWGLHASIPTRTLDTHVSRVRSKLALQPANGFRLTPVYNFGYRLERLEQGE